MIAIACNELKCKNENFKKIENANCKYAGLVQKYQTKNEESNASGRSREQRYNYCVKHKLTRAMKSGRGVYN